MRTNPGKRITLQTHCEKTITILFLLNFNNKSTTHFWMVSSELALNITLLFLKRLNILYPNSQTARKALNHKKFIVKICILYLI